jgi:xanthine dehydrogenase accessory factor
MNELRKILDACDAIVARGERGLLVTIVGTRGSTYRRSGARVAIAESGQAFGIVSGGCLERDLAERARRWLDDFTPRLVRYDSSHADDIVFGLGLGCRGELELLVEPFDAAHPPRIVELRPRLGERAPLVWITLLAPVVGAQWCAGRAGETMRAADQLLAGTLEEVRRSVGSRRVAIENVDALVEEVLPSPTMTIFGSGADVYPVAALAALTGWEVTIVSTRPLPVPAGVRNVVRHPEAIDFPDADAAVVMTHNYLHDVELLAQLLPGPLCYVGLLGPRSRGDDILAELLQQGRITDDDALRLHFPIGLDLGGDSPEAIALSIVAEVQAALNGREGGFLKDRKAPIHESGNGRGDQER